MNARPVELTSSLSDFVRQHLLKHNIRSGVDFEVQALLGLEVRFRYFLSGLQQVSDARGLSKKSRQCSDYIDLVIFLACA
jgi:hypothetical protein